MSKKDDEINRQLIFNSGGANPEDYLTPKQLQRYNENPDKFIDIDVDLAMNQEEELKKAREQYEAENQEIYDEVTKGNEELRRKKDNKPETYEQLPLFTRLNDAIDGKINQFTNFVSEAAEDKEGISDDIVRGTLKGLQFVGNLPVIKQLGQAEEAIVGGVRNLAERQDLIDPRSFTYSTRIGLAFLGDKGIRKSVQTARALKGKLFGAVDNPNSFVVPEGSVGAMRNPNRPNKKPKKRIVSTKQEAKRKAGLASSTPFQNARVYKDVEFTNKLRDELVLTWGMKDGTIDFDRYLAVRKTLPPSKRRLLAELFETPQYTRVSFSDAQAALIKETGGLKDKYRNIIDNLGFPERQFQLHHVTPVLGSLPGYHGLRFASPEWWEVTDILFKNMLRPGNDMFNFVELVGGNKVTKLPREGMKPRVFPTPHSVTHKYLDRFIGDDGQLFWTKDVRDKMAGTGKYAKKGPNMDFRRQKWQEYAELVQRSEDITNQAEEVFRDLYEVIPIEGLDDELPLLIERLSKLDSDGSLGYYRTGSGRYEVTQMKELVMEVGKELFEFDAELALRSLTRLQNDYLYDFVQRMEFSREALRKLDTLPLSQQMFLIQKQTGMSVDDVNELLRTNPGFDLVKFIRDNQ
tara:strand:- start:178 stop:2076 length:1899 start_codon:yes stop_codon:yes gene_type:complete